MPRSFSLFVSWSWDAKKIYNFIRAQTKPYPGAFTIFQKNKLIIWEALYRSSMESGKQAGEVFVSNHSLFVACGVGAIQLAVIEVKARIYKQREVTNLFTTGETLGE